MQQPMLDPAMKAFTEREFVGETIAWAEKPDVRLRSLAGFGIWVFAIPWTVFSITWESFVIGPFILEWLGYPVSGIKLPGGGFNVVMIAMGIFGIPFILVGFGMLATPFWALRKARSTLYVLTNKRVAVLEGAREITVQSIPLADVFVKNRKEKPDGRGTIILHHGFHRDSDNDRVETTTELGVINDVRRVEKLIETAKDRSRNL